MRCHPDTKIAQSDSDSPTQVLPSLTSCLHQGLLGFNVCTALASCSPESQVLCLNVGEGRTVQRICQYAVEGSLHSKRGASDNA